ncbi:MAG: RNA polymerase sigma factor [Akkermansiaceae bacterium]
MNKHFQSTCWQQFKLVNSGNPKLARRAMNEICTTYWQPLLHFAQSIGCSLEDAEDCVQGFLARASSDEFFAKADPEKGRMRSFLLVTFRRYIYDEWRKSNSQKRGGGTVQINFDDCDEQSPDSDPAIAYDQKWAVTVIGTAKENLQDRYASQGKAEIHRALEFCIDGTPLEDFKATASELDMSDSALKAAVFRIRKRFGEEVRKAVAETVANENDIDDELSWLIEVLNK